MGPPQSPQLRLSGTPKDKKKGLCKLSSCTNETTCVPNPAGDDYECVAKGGEEPTKPAADGGEEEGTEPEDGGAGAATEPPAEAVRDAQAKYAMRAINEAERNMAKDRNVAKQKLAEIGSAFDQEFDEKTNSRNSYRL